MADILEPKPEPRVTDGPQYGVPSVQELIGLALPMVGTYGELDNKQQKVALIDEVG